MLCRRKYHLAFAGILLSTAAISGGVGEARAAQDAPRAIPLRNLPATAASADRIIVKYKVDSAAARNVAGKLSLVDAAAARASVVMARAGVAAQPEPATSRHVRRMAVGSEVIQLSRPLGRAELGHLLRELNADRAVEYAEIDERMHPLHTPNDPLYASHQWNFHGAAGGLRMPQAWDMSSGAGVVVAVLDTGVLPDHPDLSANLLPGYDFITLPFLSRRPTAERVPGAVDLGDWNDDPNQCDVSDSSWHGTHVSGTVAQVTDNAAGVAGVAFDAKVLPVRVLGRCGGQLSDIADAIVWASGGTVEDVAPNAYPAEVINMSLGGSGACGATYQNAIDLAVNNGSVVVVAAGNSGDDAGRYRPASCNNVISVGATRIGGGRAFYSNYGAAVDISAPGGGGPDDPGNGGWDGYVLQSGSVDKQGHQGTYSYVGMIGTSMAAPHVAGVAALVQGALVGQERAPLAADEMEVLLKQTARPFPVAIPGTTPMGVGIVNAKAALDKALEEPCEVDCTPTATELVNRVELRNLSNTSNSGVYRFEAVAGQVLSFLSMGGVGNASLYAAFGRVPSETDFDAKSARAGNIETIRFTAPQAGTYYLRLTGAYEGLTLVARQ